MYCVGRCGIYEPDGGVRWHSGTAQYVLASCESSGPSIHFYSCSCQSPGMAGDSFLLHCKLDVWIDAVEVAEKTVRPYISLVCNLFIYCFIVLCCHYNIYFMCHL